MKYFFIALSMLLALSAPSAAPAVRASADELRYAVAAGPDVPFYASESDEEGLFLIPETYYVHVLYEGGAYTAVEYLVNDPPYQKLVGYCRSEDLTFVDFVPARPYLRKQITVSYTIPNGSDDAFQDVFDSVERTFVYYGMRYRAGRLYLYVLSEGKFGYIPSEAEPEFERNTDFLNVPSEPADAENGGGSSGMGAAQIVVLCIVCAAAVVIAVLVLRGKRPSPPPDPSEEP